MQQITQGSITRPLVGATISQPQLGQARLVQRLPTNQVGLHLHFSGQKHSGGPGPLGENFQDLVREVKSLVILFEPRFSTQKRRPRANTADRSLLPRSIYPTLLLICSK